MRGVPRPLLALGLAGVVVGGTVPLAVAVPRAIGDRAPSTAPGAASAVAPVTRGTIRSVVVLDGVAVPAPAITIQSPAVGIVVTEKMQAGTSVRSGQEVARVRLDGGESVTVIAPAAGLIRSWLVSDGDPVRLGDPLGSLDPGGFLAHAVVAPELLYRFYGPPVAIKVKLDKGPAPFDCPFSYVGAAVNGSESDPSSVPVHLRCSIPEGIRVFAGLRLKLAAVTGESRNVLMLPLQAVAGEADRGFVTLVDENGLASQRDVLLGLTDGVNIEIVDGLSEGDRVAVPPADGSSVLVP